MALDTVKVAGIFQVQPERLAVIGSTLVKHGLTDPNVQIGIYATIKVETGHMAPITEFGDETYFQRYDGRADLGNTEPGDGYRYRGRGYVQITGRANYKLYGGLIGKDLLANPDLALDPETAAEILCLFFQRSGAAKAAIQQDWTMCRRRVNGGLDGFPVFMAAVTALEKAA